MKLETSCCTTCCSTRDSWRCMAARGLHACEDAAAKETKHTAESICGAGGGESSSWPQEDCVKPTRGATPFCGAHANLTQAYCCGQPGCRKAALTGSLLCMQHALLLEQRPCDAQGCTETAYSGSSLCAQHRPWQGQCAYSNCAKGPVEVSAMRCSDVARFTSECSRPSRESPPVKSRSTLRETERMPRVARVREEATVVNTHTRAP